MQGLTILISAVLSVTVTTAQTSGWSGIASCVFIIANDSSIIPLPTATDTPISQNYTLQAFKAVCNNKDSFIDCVDKSLSSEKDDTISLFKPLFDVTTVTDAYTGLCNSITDVENEDNLSCLTNTTALMPCYAQFNSYFEYLSVFMRLGSGEDKGVSDAATRSFICTLAKRRIECEVSVLKQCSVKMSDVMGTFYERSLPAACRDSEDQGKMMPTPTM
ncbi:hypothetical protein SNE40_016713 [Patella caerulea]